MENGQHHFYLHGLYRTGGVSNNEKVRGIEIWPPCKEEGGSLAVGSVSDVLSETSSYNETNGYAVRDALAGGDRNNWEKLGGITVFNGDTWPGMPFGFCFDRRHFDKMRIDIFCVFIGQ